MIPEDQIALLRETIGSIDLSGITDEPVLTEDERKNRAAIASAFWTTQFEPVLKRLIREQEQKTALEVPTWDGVLAGRGTLNGLYLVLEWFEGKVAEHRAFTQKETVPERDPSHPFPSIA